MIIKCRELPAKINGYEALLKRLSPRHPKRTAIKTSLHKARADYGGEERLDEALYFFDPPYAYQMIQDFSLDEPFKIQVDTVLITQSCVILLEVKNSTGKLQFKQNPSLLHTISVDGEVKSDTSPITQMDETALRVEKILRTMGYKLPVSSIMVVAHPSQIVEEVPRNCRILAVGDINFYLSTLNLPTPILSLEELHELGKTLLTLHQNVPAFPLAPKFQIEQSEIETGVFCPRCHLGKMERTTIAWECETCRLISRNAHLTALDEWFMLLKSSISTAECCGFIGMTNLETAKHFLMKNGCQPVGGRRYRHYTRQ
ncbi:nuclease-related domain-containing protein [Planococcus faecalis]|uniref:NERD nuclease n=1 Tax=Planococcus faecalis TaxID=1598147 RepID=A0ABN4XNW8_9BACL|nr:nuclease-related domain-containing protein [Planococcus faecalis]AQU80273.1 NERD nuclease [Planococcus faecalis]OHX55097.1 NERD nuclease [Planococcus faecalis]